MNMNELAEEILEINRKNGWDCLTPDDLIKDPNKIVAQVGLIMTEAAEAIEGYREKDFANFREELADVIIRTLDMTAGLGIDIDREITAKLIKNKGRGHRHGGKSI